MGHGVCVHALATEKNLWAKSPAKNKVVCVCVSVSGGISSVCVDLGPHVRRSARQADW